MRASGWAGASGKLASDEFGVDGHWFAGVRQSRLGVKTSTPTSMGDLKTTFEFELFGTGVDAGQTTLRLRHAYGELGQFGAGQTWSPFMDIDVFPNTVEYWGPNGMVFFRNVQVRWMPVQGGGFRLVTARGTYVTLDRELARTDHLSVREHLQTRASEMGGSFVWRAGVVLLGFPIAMLFAFGCVLRSKRGAAIATFAIYIALAGWCLATVLPQLL